MRCLPILIAFVSVALAGLPAENSAFAKGGKAAKSFYPYLAKKDDQIQKMIKLLFGTAFGRRLG